MARVDLPQSKLKARKRRRRLVVLLQLSIAFTLVFGVLAIVSRLPHVRIAKIVIVGAEGASAELLKNTAVKNIEGSYALVFPKNNILLYPKEALIQNLYAEFPRLAEVDVYAENFRTLAINVRERVPKALWCGASPAARSPCLLMDEGGKAYEPSADFSGPVYVEYFGTSTGESLPQQYLTVEQFRPLSALVTALKDMQGQVVVSVVVDEHHDVYVRFENNFTLMFNLRDNSGDVYERFVLAQTAEPFKNHNLSDFEYLDLRFGDRLYYKLKIIQI